MRWTLHLEQMDQRSLVYWLNAVNEKWNIQNLWSLTNSVSVCAAVLCKTDESPLCFISTLEILLWKYSAVISALSGMWEGTVLLSEPQQQHLLYNKTQTEAVIPTVWASLSHWDLSPTSAKREKNLQLTDTSLMNLALLFWFHPSADIFYEFGRAVCLLWQCYVFDVEGTESCLCIIMMKLFMMSSMFCFQLSLVLFPSARKTGSKQTGFEILKGIEVVVKSYTKHL